MIFFYNEKQGRVRTSQYTEPFIDLDIATFPDSIYFFAELTTEGI